MKTCRTPVCVGWTKCIFSRAFHLGYISQNHRITVCLMIPFHLTYAIDSLSARASGSHVEGQVQQSFWLGGRFLNREVNFMYLNILALDSYNSSVALLTSSKSVPPQIFSISANGTNIHPSHMLIIPEV